MCFGNTTTDTTKNTTYTPTPAVSNAATANLTYATNQENTPFSPYTGNQVAPFGSLQQQSFNSAASPDISNMINSYASAPAQTVSPGTISGAMSPYFNQYVNYALAPQIQAQQQQFDTQNKNLDAAATSSGAYGDARAGIEAANLTTQQNIARQGLIGNAYNSAFNTAIGAGAQDVANNLQGQVTNANLAETANARQLTGANALEGVLNQQNQFGQQQTAQSQAGLNAAYNQWLMGQQRPYQNIQALNSAVQAGAYGMPANTSAVTQSPDNSGFGLLGSAASLLAAPFTGGTSLFGLAFGGNGGTSSGSGYGYGGP